MKKIIIGLVILASAVTLAACGKKTMTTTTTQGTDTLSAEAELVVGTMKLDKTDLAVTADQAKTLLPLWQTYQTLSSSSTAATEEMNALIDQIKAAMTSQQVEKITSMKLTQQDMMTAMTDAGVGFGGASGTPNATQQANGQFFQGPPEAGNDGGRPSFSTGGGSPPSGGGPGGGSAPPSGGFVIQGDGGGPAAVPGQSATPQAVRGNGFADRVPPPLLNALIQMLQKMVT